MSERRQETVRSSPSGNQQPPCGATLTELAERLENMGDKLEKISTKVWLLGEHVLFLDDELKRLRAGEPSRRLPSGGLDPGKFAIPSPVIDLMVTNGVGEEDSRT